MRAAEAEFAEWLAPLPTVPPEYAEARELAGYVFADPYLSLKLLRHAETAMREDPGATDLVARPLGHLFGSNVTRVAFRRGAYLRQFVYAFAELLDARLSAALIQRTMSGRWMPLFS